MKLFILPGWCLLSLLSLASCNQGGGASSSASAAAEAAKAPPPILVTELATTIVTDTLSNIETVVTTNVITLTEGPMITNTIINTTCTDGTAPVNGGCTAPASLCTNGIIASGANQGSSCEVALVKTMPMIYFGGMYSKGHDNVISGNGQGCPTGYSGTQVTGLADKTNQTDPNAPLYLCVYNPASAAPTAKVPTRYVAFGGMYGYGGSTDYVNPVTGKQRCPSGYNFIQVYGTNAGNADGTNTSIVSGSLVHNALYACWKEMTPKNMKPALLDQAVSFGGMSSNVYGNAVNGGSAQAGCPNEYSKVTMLDTAGVDNELSLCFKPIAGSFGG